MLRRNLVGLRPMLSVCGPIGLLLAQCGGGDLDPPSRSGSSAAAIIGGVLAAEPDSPVLFLHAPQGDCSAVLIAPRLVVTSRHCVARTVPGGFACTSAGELVLTGNGAGEIGSDFEPSALSFFTVQTVGGGAVDFNAPEAVGAKILSTLSPTSCRDDIAFVVLDRPLSMLKPAAVRLLRPSEVGETVSVWGFGLTERLEPTALRMLAGVKILGVGPTLPADDTQLAPVRSVRLDSVTCEGDSGGPVFSEAGAVIGVISLGDQTGPEGPFCRGSGLATTVAARLDAYRDLALSAFAAADERPIDEGSALDAGVSVDAPMSREADVRADEGVHEAAPGGGEPMGGCSLGPIRPRILGVHGAATAALALVALARRRRNR